MKLPLRDLNPDPYSLHPTNSYTCEMTITPRVYGAAAGAVLKWTSLAIIHPLRQPLINIKVVSIFKKNNLLINIINKTLHKVWNFSSISIIQLSHIVYGDQFVKNSHTWKWKIDMERGKVTFTISLSPPSSLQPYIYAALSSILLLTCDLTYKNHHTPILTYNKSTTTNVK